jgi:hypothetical protein
MLIGYGYGYPTNQLLGGGAVNPYWAAFNVRADADGALPAEAAVNGCLQTRFLNSFQDYNFFVWTDTVWSAFNTRCDADSATAKETLFENCLQVRTYNLN